MTGLAVGCRPFYLLMTPFFIYLSIQKKHSIIKTIIFWGFGLAPMGVFLTVYNYIRFDSIFEFGHNYLPVYSQGFKQFDIKYLKNGSIYLPIVRNSQIQISRTNSHRDNSFKSSDSDKKSESYYFCIPVSPLSGGIRCACDGSGHAHHCRRLGRPSSL